MLQLFPFGCASLLGLLSVLTQSYRLIKHSWKKKKSLPLPEQFLWKQFFYRSGSSKPDTNDVNLFQGTGALSNRVNLPEKLQGWKSLSSRF